MNKIRKGSIVWDIKRKQFTKVLSSKNELPDKATKNTGEKYHRIMTNIVLCKDPEGNQRYCNAPCYMVRSWDLIPRKEYLNQRYNTRNALIKSKLL